MTTHGSIGSSTMSTFDPDNEAIVSTRQLDQDYIIDNSALRRAFPDFSTGSTKSDISVEIGRGYQHQKVQGQLADSRNVSYKENLDPLPLKKHQDSHQRRYERPALGTSNRQSSRFSPPKTRQRSGEQEVTTTQQQTTTSILLRTLNAARKGSSSKAAPTTKSHPAIPATVEYEPSYMAAEMTTISEVVTGTLQFNSRVDRVTSTPHVQNPLPPVAVPVPQDQQALFATLKLLQDKVAGLEEGQAQMRRTIEDLRTECSTLKQELRTSREHSPVPAIDADEEGVFDISMPRIPKRKSQEAITAAPVPETQLTSGDTLEVLRETIKPNAPGNILRREVNVPVPLRDSDSEKKCFGMEIKLNFQGLSLG